MGIWVFMGFCYTNWTPKLREVGCWAVCLVRRDLLIEEMPVLTLGAGSVNTADSKSRVKKSSPKAERFHNPHKSPPKASKRRVAVKQQCREVENEGIIFPAICVL